MISSEWHSENHQSCTPSQAGEAICNKYIDLIHSKTNIEDSKAEPLDRPFDFFDDEEFAFGINLLNNNVACVGDNMTRLIQMAQEPWPDNVKLYQPYEVEQILLPDNASCLAVQAFLKMCNLPFEVEMRWNAEFMSPSGRVPFIKCGAFVVSELEPIVQFVANKGVSLCSKLSTEEKAEMRAYMSLITNVLVNAELYISWIDDETFNSVTKIRNSSVYPWPLSWFQTRSKRSSVAKRLKALNWHNKTLDNVLADVEQCCNSLSQRLGDREFFFGTPTPLDALIYGHTRALLSWNGSRAPLLIKPITSALLKHALRMAKLTQMILTPQEDYLMTQAFSLGGRRRSSPERLGVSERTRARRSKMSLGLNRDNVAGEGRDVFGFKPFTSKQVIVMTSKEGYVTCEYENQVKVLTLMDEGKMTYIYDILEEILNKVNDEIQLNEQLTKNDGSFNSVGRRDDCNERLYDKDNCGDGVCNVDDRSAEKINEQFVDSDRCDFEIISYPLEEIVLKCGGAALETIHEKNTSEATITLNVSDNAEEPVVSKSSDIKIVNDSLSSVYEKPTVVDGDNLHGNDEAEGSVVSVDSSANKELSEAYSSNLERHSNKSSEGTCLTLKNSSASDGEISVESLLKTLKDRDCRSFLEVDVD